MEQEGKKERKKFDWKKISLPQLIVLLLCGVALILISFPNLFTSKDKTAKPTASSNETVLDGLVQQQKGATSTTETYVEQLEKKLENILKQVENIGDVEVMITLAESKEQVVLKDAPYTKEDLNETDSQGGTRINKSTTMEDETIMVESSDGKQEPYIVKEIEPKIEGVVVIAKGGGDANVMTEIVDAVEVLFDVPAHKIKVMKMNQQ